MTAELAERWVDASDTAFCIGENSRRFRSDAADEVFQNGIRAGFRKFIGDTVRIKVSQVGDHLL
jgi:hypothetical protein